MMEDPCAPSRNPSTTALAGSVTSIGDGQALGSVDSYDRPPNSEADYDEDSGAVSLADDSVRSANRYSRIYRAQAGCPSVSAACGTTDCALLMENYDDEDDDEHHVMPRRNIILPNPQRKAVQMQGRQKEQELLRAASQLTSVLPPGMELDHEVIERIKKLRSSLLRLPTRFDDGDSTTQFSIQQNDDGDKTSTMSEANAAAVPVVKMADVVGDSLDVCDEAKPEGARTLQQDEMVSASMQTTELRNVGVQCPETQPTDNSVVYFHDIVPRALSVGGSLFTGGDIVYESIPVLLARANKWLQRNFMCKARFVEIVRLPSKAACHSFAEELESDEIEQARVSSYFTAAPDKPTFVKALRLWLTHNTDAGMVPQQLGHYYAMPFAPLGDSDSKGEGKKAKSATLERLRRFAAHPNSLFDAPYGPGGDGPQISSAMENCKFGQLVDEVNRIAEHQNLRGKILSVLTDIAPIHEENPKEECTASFQFGEDKSSYCEKRQPTCTVLRVFYELGALKIPKIRIKDFVPERVIAPNSRRSHEAVTFAEIFGLGYRNRSKGARRKRKIFTGYAELHDKVAEWFNRQQSISLKHHGRCPSVNLVNIQTVLMKTCPNGKLDTNKTVFVSTPTTGQNHEYVKFLRVAYTAAHQTLDPKECNEQELQKKLYLSRKVFLPTRLQESKLSTLEAVVTGRRPSLESNEDIWRRIAEFVAARSLKGNFFEVETLSMPFECFEGLEKCQRSQESGNDGEQQRQGQQEPSSFLVDPRLTDHTWVTAFQVYLYSLDSPCENNVAHRSVIDRVESDTFDVEASVPQIGGQCPCPGEPARAMGGTGKGHKKSNCCVM